LACSFNHEDGSDIYLRNIGLLFITLHGAISQRTANFIFTAVRDLNVTLNGRENLEDIDVDVRMILMCGLRKEVEVS
jgi:hypothetical protein